MPVISTPTLAPEQVWAMRWLAQASFYARPSLVAREARRVRSAADLVDKVKPAVVNVSSTQKSTAVAQNRQRPGGQGGQQFSVPPELMEMAEGT